MSHHKEIISLISVILADSYALAVKTQNYHWNVSGPEFYSLHKLFEEQYSQIFDAIDEIAERIKALGGYAPGSFSEYAKLTNISDAIKKAPSKDMLKDLAKSHKIVIDELKKTIKKCLDHNDEATADLLIGRVEEHEKMLWMLEVSC